MISGEGRAHPVAWDGPTAFADRQFDAARSSILSQPAGGGSVVVGLDGVGTNHMDERHSKRPADGTVPTLNGVERKKILLLAVTHFARHKPGSRQPWLGRAVYVPPAHGSAVFHCLVQPGLTQTQRLPSVPPNGAIPL